MESNRLVVNEAWLKEIIGLNLYTGNTINCVSKEQRELLLEVIWP
jgi:hypothetical protein